MRKYTTLIINKSFMLGISVGISLCLYLYQTSLKNPAYKFNKVLKYVEKYYVDKIDSDDLQTLTDAAIKKLAKQLDPHSTYIDAKQSAISQINLKGQFEGIGIEFIILQDTIYIINVIPKGPAEQAGIQIGDRIVKINDRDWIGKDLSFNKIIEIIRGPKGSTVKLSIQRGKEKNLLEMTVSRDRIPTSSIDASYMIDNQIGYIKLSQFTSRTHVEFMENLNRLVDQGMQKFLLDLRDNTGGYLRVALDIAEEMLEPGKLIIYTKGKCQKFNTQYYANGKNSLKKMPVIVLINEHTASAPELLAGALQDHDRALIVGRRSFGKGLVQWPIELKDKSILNLTVERYFTPSGRFIQKPYDKNVDYRLDLFNRYNHGEYFHADSIEFDNKLAYHTSTGRTVYGGSGIMPDYFIPLDTIIHSNYIKHLLDKYVIQQYAIEYVRSNKQKLEKMDLGYYVENFYASETMLKQLVEHAKKAEIKQGPISTQMENSIKHLLKAHIAKILWQYQGFYTVYNKIDTTILNSLQLFVQAEALLQENIAYLANRARRSIKAEKVIKSLKT